MVILPLSFAGGILLGALFFGGLWWTIRKAVSSSQPASWFLGSMVLRTGTVLAGFYLLGHGDWRRLLLSLFGFVTARIAVTMLTRPQKELSTRSEEAPVHAP
ncbi:ATP synthase subunit I [soil metagenome]